MKSELRGTFGRQWGDWDNPEQYILSREIERDYHPAGVMSAAVKYILNHPSFEDLYELDKQLIDLIKPFRKIPEITKEFETRFGELAEKRDEVYDKIEKDLDKNKGIRPNAAEFRTALRFAHELKRG